MPVVAILWVISRQVERRTNTDGQDQPESEQPNIVLSLALFAFLSLSRLGVWIFDLTTQQLTQMMVTETSSFAGVEASVVNVFELAGAVAAIGFPQMDHFKYLALASYIVALVAWVMYESWERRRRSQLLH
jgi:solute carrier family 40 (iron-regulated transporter), member 1